MRRDLLLALGLNAGLTMALAGQSLVRRITSVTDGEVRIAFAAREGICGDGRTYIRDRNRDGYYMHSHGSGQRWRERFCEDGPVRVAIKMREGRVRSARTYVGGDWPDAGSGVTDLGTVGARPAAEGLLELARSSTYSGDDLVFPSTIADSVTIWPSLLALARDRDAPRTSRKQAVFWVSQAAGDKAADGLGQLAEDEDEDREVREQAVFALSQLPKDEGVPILIRVARTNKSPDVRRKALFWLGQSEDPRALALFEEILTKKE